MNKFFTISFYWLSGVVEVLATVQAETETQALEAVTGNIAWVWPSGAYAATVRHDLEAMDSLVISEGERGPDSFHNEAVQEFKKALIKSKWLGMASDILKSEVHVKIPTAGKASFNLLDRKSLGYIPWDVHRVR